MSLEAIAAIGTRGELGLNNDLLWHISKDLKNFKRITQGHIVVMGRKTFDSLKKPLPNRLNIVFTQKSASSFSPEVMTFSEISSFASWLKKRRDKSAIPFIIGGGEIYKLFWPYLKTLHLSRVNYSGPADTFFPFWSREDLHSEWELKEERNHPETHNQLSWCYERWERKLSHLMEFT